MPVRFIPTYVGHTAAPARGAYVTVTAEAVSEIGSSPHTWGIRRARQAYIDQRRFIPTYVGHTRCAKRRWPGGPVHPHIRGAYISPRHSAERLSGSSPHTWGIRRYDAPDQQARRFIPTYVGHTCATSRNLRNTSVHPHIRGAYEGFTLLNCVDFGSSPHTWGIRMRPVHPHIRGAYIPSAGAYHRPPGSSPHTWGIRPSFSIMWGIFRFIPTYVGHTENTISFMLDVPGSSPHTWGILVNRHLQEIRVRFIPTYVGHTGYRQTAGRSGRFIPTYVGHTVIGPAANRLKDGSSPHTWGIHRSLHPQRSGPRFIPTYVGHTSTSGGCHFDHPGSSPHTWGIRSGTLPPARTWRFIPTYVGHTRK